jgi:hypothetical protein
MEPRDGDAVNNEHLKSSLENACRMGRQWEAIAGRYAQLLDLTCSLASSMLQAAMHGSGAAAGLAAAIWSEYRATAVGAAAAERWAERTPQAPPDRSGAPGGAAPPADSTGRLVWRGAGVQLHPFLRPRASGVRGQRGRRGKGGGSGCRQDLGEEAGAAGVEGRAPAVEAVTLPQDLPRLPSLDTSP